MEAYIEKIEVRKVESSPERLSYRINQIDPSVLNALRRTIISDTPTIAIQWVFIRENETVMADEILAHRLGLIPVVADPSLLKPLDLKNITNPAEHLSHENSIAMELIITNTTDQILPIYSDDIKIHGMPSEVTLKKKVLITRLAPKKRIECKIYAVLGTGRDHAKWMPTSVCYYRAIKKVELKDPGRADEIKKYFRDGFTISTNGPVINEDKLLVNTDVQKAYPDVISIKTEKNSFLFEIETISESPIKIIKRGLEVLQKKLRDLQIAAESK